MVEYQFREEIEISFDNISLMGDLAIPARSDSIIIFAHGSGSSRQSSRNRSVAQILHEAGFATLLFDLLTVLEDEDYARRFQIDLLTDRLIKTTHWLQNRPDFNLNIGYFGASTGAPATLEAAAKLGDVIKAVVSRGGRPDLAIYNLPVLKSPTLLIVGSLDHEVIKLNQKAYQEIKVEKELVIIEGATHLFEEPGKLEEVAAHATGWFARHLRHVYAQ
jgi:putative phosphoribosyl transferase